MVINLFIDRPPNQLLSKFSGSVLIRLELKMLCAIIASKNEKILSLYAFGNASFLSGCTLPVIPHYWSK